uniref:Uncharacterized protein n=1 Tax=Strigamia maritima TaxID=126957 RepID=T1J228_STRMM
MASCNNKNNYIKLKYVLIPRASNILRELFRKKWLAAVNSSWSETDEQGQRFIEGSGKNIFVTTNRRRKILLRSGIVDLWDLQLLSTVLLTFNFGNGSNLTKQEKKAIASLAVIHSDFRKSSTGINLEEFDVAWESISQILVKLGDSSDELKLLKLDKLKSMEMDKHSVSSSGDTRSESLTLELRNRGNKFFQEHNFIDAVAVYTQTIPIQRCKIQSALLYSNRSAAYLALPNDILFYKQKMEKAKDDIKNAIELCPTWYKAHYRLGCFYEELNNHKKAAKHLEIALILDPSKIEISNKLEKVKSFIKSPDSDVNVELSMEDFMATGIANQIRGASHWTAWKGYCYLKGIQVEKDYKLAAELFVDAVNDNNAFAMVQLASMYLLGQGVKKDRKMHVQLLLKAASLPHIQMNGQINNHVINAKYFLGLAYHKGFGVFPDLEKAFVWFKKATDNGCPNSPFDLGNLYFKGTGVIKDEEKAVYYWQLAADRGFVEACGALSDYYFSQVFDPDKAVQWHRRFMTESKIPEESENSSFEVNIANLRQRIDVSKIRKWEADQRIHTKGLSLRDRIRRFVKGNVPDCYGFERKCLEIGKKYLELKGMETITEDDIHYPYPFKLNMLKEFTSATAERIEQAVIHFSKAVRYLKASEKFEFPIIISFVMELSDCLKVEPLVAHWDKHDRKIAVSIVEDFWYDQVFMNSLYSYLVNSYFEVQVSICYVYFHQTSCAVEMKNLLKSYTEKCPEEFYFYSMFLRTLLLLEDYEEGAKEAQLALKKFPNNCELLLYRAKHMRGLGKNTSQVIKAYEDFLAVAEPDHPEVPAAYYEIAFAYSNLKMLHQSSDTSGKVVEYYFEGLEAEKIQLPCFLPYKRCDCFEVLSKIVSGMKCGAGNSNSEEELMNKFPLVNVDVAIDDIVGKPIVNVSTAEEILSKTRENNLEKNVPVGKRNKNRKRKKQHKNLNSQSSESTEIRNDLLEIMNWDKNNDLVQLNEDKENGSGEEKGNSRMQFEIVKSGKKKEMRKFESRQFSTIYEHVISTTAMHEDEDISIASKQEEKFENEVDVGGEISLAKNIPSLQLNRDDKMEKESENGDLNSEKEEIIDTDVEFVDVNYETKMIAILQSQKELKLSLLPQNFDKNAVNQSENNDGQCVDDVKRKSNSTTPEYKNATFEILASAVQMKNKSKNESFILAQINCDQMSDFSAARENYIEGKDEFEENTCDQNNASCSSLVVIPNQAPTHILIEENITVLEILLGIRDPYTLYSNVKDFLSDHLPQLGIFCFKKLAMFSITAAAYLSKSDDSRTSHAQLKDVSTVPANHLYNFRCNY